MQSSPLPFWSGASPSQFVWFCVAVMLSSAKFADKSHLPTETLPCPRPSRQLHTLFCQLSGSPLAQTCVKYVVKMSGQQSNCLGCCQDGIPHLSGQPQQRWIVFSTEGGQPRKTAAASDVPYSSALSGYLHIYLLLKTSYSYIYHGIMSA